MNYYITLAIAGTIGWVLFLLERRKVKQLRQVVEEYAIQQQQHAIEIGLLKGEFEAFKHKLQLWGVDKSE